MKLPVFTLPKLKFPSAKPGPLKLNAFTGVFVPTFLSIIGVILYLRLGSLVGNLGVLGTLSIILLAVSVTIATGLSLSSITTNIKIGAGGPYSIISKTLGLEVGGSVGIPLYLAQIFSVALYLLGFTEVWQWLFPNHPTQLILLGVFTLLFFSVVLSTRLAIKLQIVVFGFVLLSLVSIWSGGEWWTKITETLTVGTSTPPGSDATYWALFAIFFPAVTGLMAGIGLSGQLSDSKRQIPIGILTAVGITTVIYILCTLWLGTVADAATLRNDTMAMINQAAWPSLVIIGVLAATFSSALTTFMAAPRLLFAMADNRVVPFSPLFLRVNKRQDPYAAIIFSSGLVLFLLLIGNLNSIASVLTMFFLITYVMINLVVFIEQSLGAVSFRPTLKIPKLVPLYGATVSVLFMFLINALVGLMALSILLLTYLFLVQRRLEAREGDVRSGIFAMVAEWAAKKVMLLPENRTHTWKPNVLLPVVTTRTLLGNFPLIKALTFPNGTMTVLGLKLTDSLRTPEDANLTRSEAETGLTELPRLVKKFSKEKIFTASSTVEVHDYTNGICVALEAIRGQVFHPNILFLPFKPSQLKKPELERIFTTAQRSQAGVMLFDRDQDIGLGSEEDIHIWLPDRTINPNLYENDRMFDLGMILAYRLYNNWNGELHVWMCTSDENKEKARYYIKKLIYEARFPSSTQVHISTSEFIDTLKKAPQGDIHIIPINPQPDIARLRKISKIRGKSFLFVSDSDQEDMLA